MAIKKGSDTDIPYHKRFWPSMRCCTLPYMKIFYLPYFLLIIYQYLTFFFRIFAFLLMSYFQQVILRKH